VPSNTSVVNVEHLSRRFGDTLAVDNLTLDIFRGEVFGLLGHNGAGKTTTIRLITGVLTPSSGRVRVLGLSSEDDGPAVRQQIGVLTETPALYEPLTARDNLTIFANLYDIPVAEVPGRVNAVLATFELADRANEKVGGYSKGMKQRLALARALLHAPQILFLDEPTAGLDPVAARVVHDLILRLSHDEERTVFLCTHNLIEAQRLCHRVAVLERGRVMALGTPAELSHHLADTLQLEIEIAAGQREQARAVLGEKGAVDEDGVGASHDPLLQATFDTETLTLTGVRREAIPDVLAALVNAGVRVYRLVPYEPTLEDVYFALHDKVERPL
jgi:ABC-2 type transport system ATP-binding protein